MNFIKKGDETMSRIMCLTEYAPLEEVVLCEPVHMRIDEAINDIQKHFAEENINQDLATKQHRALVKILRDHNIIVHLLPAHHGFPEQVFTRDIGFTIDETLYVASLKRTIRQGEQQVLKQQLSQKQIPYKTVDLGTIEGGDVIIDNDTVYVGESSRTSRDSVEQLQIAHPDRTFHIIKFDETYLHLDCVFNPVSASVALIYPEAIANESLKILEQCYDLIEVTKEEQFHLATNVLSIGNNNIISLPQNVQANQKLWKAGFTVIETDLSEIIKSGGSFRCITLPIRRKREHNKM